MYSEFVQNMTVFVVCVGSATPTRDEPTETETKPVLKEEATDSRVAPVADTRAADRPTSSAPPAEQQVRRPSQNRPIGGPYIFVFGQK